MPHTILNLISTKDGYRSVGKWIPTFLSVYVTQWKKARPLESYVIYN
jgi:hypothetical protein